MSTENIAIHFNGIMYDPTSYVSFHHLLKQWAPRFLHAVPSLHSQFKSKICCVILQTAPQPSQALLHIHTMLLTGTQRSEKTDAPHPMGNDSFLSVNLWHSCSPRGRMWLVNYFVVSLIEVLWPLSLPCAPHSGCLQCQQQRKLLWHVAVFYFEDTGQEM